MQITENARKHLNEVLHRAQAGAIRIFFAGISCGGPKLGLTLGEPREQDTVLCIHGINFAIDKRILSRTHTLTLDYQMTPDGSQLVFTGMKHHHHGCC